MTRAARREVVLASAGSGKTYRLSAAYLELIAHGADPRGVLATTFTRKAAGEIARRVLRRGVEAATDPEASARLDAETGAGLGCEGWGRSVSALARRVESMRVRTIDSFFVSVAQGATSALGLTPGWRLMSEHEAEVMRLRAVDRAIEDGTRDETLELLRMLHGGDPKSSVIESVARLAHQGSDAFWAADASPDAWHAVQEPPGVLEGAALAEAIEGARRLALPEKKSGGVYKTWAGAVGKLIEGTESANPAYALDSKLCERLFEEGVKFDRSEITEEHREALGPLVRHARALMVRSHLEQTSATYTLIARTELALEGLKRSAGAWTFGDIPRLLGRLGSAELLGVLDDVDAGVEHLLLDEYQDTSMEQHALVAGVLDEIASDPTGARGAVCVGDVKQSLYMWREATPEILGTLSARYPTLGVETLAQSWRTSSVVLDEVNDVFDGIATNEALEGERRAGGEAFAAHWEAQSAARDLPGFFALEAVDASEDASKGVSRFERAAEVVREIVDRAPGATVGVLTRVKKNVIPRLLEALKSAGVEASEEGGNPLTDSPAVACVVSALRHAHRPAGTSWAFHAYESALGRVLGVEDAADDDEVRAMGRRVRRNLAERGPSRLFASWARALRGRMTARDASRFGQLVELAERIEREGDVSALEAGALADRIQAERVEATTGARVRVMTIHASKGLEFDAVVLADLERPFGISQDAFLVEREGDLGPVRAVTCFPRAELREASEDLARMHASAMRRHVLGELCGLYVGMTRARRWLHMIVDAPKEPGAYAPSLAGVVRSALAGGLGEEGVLHASGEVSCLDDLADTEEMAETLERVVLKLVSGAAVGAGALARRSPSSAGDEEAEVSGRRILSLERGAADAGTLIHDAFEGVAWTDEAGWAFDGEEAARDLCARRGVDASEAESAVRRVSRALESHGVRDVLSRARYGGGVELWRERAFAARVGARGEETLMRGRFDRVVVGRDDSGAIAWCEVIDFKSEADPSGDVRIAAESYRPQMEAYRAALVSMTGVRVEDVRLTLVFVDRGEVVTLGQSSEAAGSEGS